MSLSRVGLSKEAVSEAMALDLENSFDVSSLPGSFEVSRLPPPPPPPVSPPPPTFGKSLLTTGGGVERFLCAVGLSNFEARALNAGDLPLARGRSDPNDTLLDRCGFSDPDLPPNDTGALFFGF